MAAKSSIEKRADYHRRSQRIRIRIRVVIRFQDKVSPPEQTHTITVNAHGGLILLATRISLNQIIVIENSKTAQEMLCRVTTLGPTFMGKAQVAFEFIKPAPGFWGIESPPEDWGEGHVQSSRRSLVEALRKS